MVRSPPAIGDFAEMWDILGHSVSYRSWERRANRPWSRVGVSVRHGGESSTGVRGNQEGGAEKGRAVGNCRALSHQGRVGIGRLGLFGIAFAEAWEYEFGLPQLGREV